MSGHIASSCARVGVRARLALRRPGRRRPRRRGRLSGLSTCEHRRGGAQLLDLAREPRLRAGARLVAAHGVGDLGEVARARAGTIGTWCVLWRVATRRQRAVAERQPERRQARLQRLVQRGHAVVVEAAGHRAEHRHLVGLVCPGLAVALHLLGDVAQRVGRALAVELVDGDELGEVEHVDLLELAGGAELRRHHVHRHVDQRHDGRVALADAGGLDDDEVEAGDLAGGDHVGQRLADLAAEVARGERAHEDALPRRPRPPVGHGPIAFMRMRSPSSAPPLLRRDGSIEITAMRSASSWSRRRRRISSSVRHDLPAPPVPVMPSTGVLRGLRALVQLGLQRRRRRAVLERGDQLRERAPARLGAAARIAVRARVGACARQVAGRSASPSRRSFPARPMRWPSSGL